MSAKIPYTGLDKPQPHQKRATPKEASKLKQIRYYGLHKVSEEVAHEYKGISVVAKDREKKLVRMMGKLNGLLDKLKEERKDYLEEDDYKKNKAYQDAVKVLDHDIDKAKQELSKVLKKLKEFREEQQKEKDEKKK
jgi:glutamine synthetase type III